MPLIMSLQLPCKLSSARHKDSVHGAGIKQTNQLIMNVVAGSSIHGCRAKGYLVSLPPMDNLCLDDLNEGIVSSVYDASVQTVVRVKSTSLKSFWNEELDSLKQSAIFWHNV